MSWKTILLEKRDQVAVLTLNQPEKRNAMTMEMGLEFKSAIESVKQDREARVLLITGQGDFLQRGGRPAVRVRPV